MPSQRPPALARFLLEALLDADAKEFVIGDIEEEWESLSVRDAAAARRWYWNQVLRSVASRSWHRLRRWVLRIRFGGLAGPQPEPKGDPLVETILRDVRYGIRSLLQQPGFTFLVILTLALGIGANTAIFSVANAVWVRALPYPGPDRLVQVFETVDVDYQKRVPTSHLAIEDWRRSSSSFESMAAASSGTTLLLTGGEEARQLQANLVSPEYFDLLGARAQRGRLLLPEENQTPGGHPVAVISDELWQGRFGGDPQIVGQTLRLSGVSYEVVGVMAADFVDLASPSRPTEAWIPVMMATHAIQEDAIERRTVRVFAAIARLKPGRTAEMAQQELDGVAAELARLYPESSKNFGAAVVPLRQSMVGGLSGSIGALLAGAGFLLLVACINVASLILVRAHRRRRELAVRLALGATRGKVVGQLVIEAVLLALLGGAAGVLLASWSTGLLLDLSPIQLPRFMEVRLDWEVLGASFALAALAGVTFGLVPALRSSRADLRTELIQGDQRCGIGPRGMAGRNLLVILEVATAMVLLVGSGLLLRSFYELRTTEMGFRTERLLAVQVTLPALDYPERASIYSFTERVLEEIRARPGVTGASLWGPGGIPGQDGLLTTFIPEGQVVASQLEATLGRIHNVSPGALEHLQIPVLKGRPIERQDGPNGLPVVVVSESLAKELWPGEDPLGRRFRHFLIPGEDPANFPWFTVVGVVDNTKMGGRQSFGNLSSPHDAYFSNFQRRRFLRRLVFLVGSGGDPLELVEPVRAAIQSVDPDIPVFGVQTMEQAVGQEEQLSRFAAVLMGVFGALSLFLSALGIYGVLSQSVVQRTREIGLRKALGASRASTIRLFLGQGLRLVLVGIVLGLAVALALTRFLSSLLFGVAPTDLLTLAATAVALTVVAVLASGIPTWRAIKVDPAVALRAD